MKCWWYSKEETKVVHIGTNTIDGRKDAIPETELRQFRKQNLIKIVISG